MYGGIAPDDEVPTRRDSGRLSSAARGSATAAGEFPTDGSREFTLPAEGDWVLVIDDAARNLPPPGGSALRAKN